MNYRTLGICAAVFCAGLLMPVRGCHKVVPPGPGPDNQIVDGGKGTHVVVVLDESAPSVAVTRMLDDPITRGLRKAGMLTIAYLRADKEWLEKKKYDKLMPVAGGAPMLLVLDKENTSDNIVYAGRLPTDFRTRDQIFAKAIGNLPPPEAISEVPKASRRQFSFKPAYQLSLPASGASYASMPGYGDANPLLPEKEFREFHVRDVFHGNLIFDQGNHNSCVGNSGVGSLEYDMWFQGMKLTKLSPACAYSPINGGYDAGAMISDLIPALMQQGTCTFETWGQHPVFLKALPAAQREKVMGECKKYRLDNDGGYACRNWEEICSALQSGYAVTLSVGVDNVKFHTFDADGVAGVGDVRHNHAVRVDGMRKIKGQWCLDLCNSWGKWGAWDDEINAGRAYITKDHLYSFGNRTEAIAFRAVQRRPDEPNDPPAYVGRFVPSGN